MSPLPLLVVLAVAGGPVPAPGQKPQVDPLPNSTIRIQRNTSTGFRVVRQTSGGTLRMRVRPGEYKIEAQLHSQPYLHPEPKNCDSRVIHIRRGQKSRTVELFCQVS